MTASGAAILLPFNICRFNPSVGWKVDLKLLFASTVYHIDNTCQIPQTKLLILQAIYPDLTGWTKMLFDRNRLNPNPSYP